MKISLPVGLSVAALALVSPLLTLMAAEGEVETLRAPAEFAGIADEAERAGDFLKR